MNLNSFFFNFSNKNKDLIGPYIPYRDLGHIIDFNEQSK